MVLNDTHKECRKKKTTSKATNKNILYQKRLLKGVDTDKYKKMKNIIFPQELFNIGFCSTRTLRGLKVILTNKGLPNGAGYTAVLPYSSLATSSFLAR